MVQRVENHLNVLAVEFLVALQFSEFAGEFRCAVRLVAQRDERADTWMLISTVRRLLKTLAAMITPCSVKA